MKVSVRKARKQVACTLVNEKKFIEQWAGLFDVSFSVERAFYLFVKN